MRSRFGLMFEQFHVFVLLVAATDICQIGRHDQRVPIRNDVDETVSRSHWMGSFLLERMAQAVFGHAVSS